MEYKELLKKVESWVGFHNIITSTSPPRERKGHRVYSYMEDQNGEIFGVEWTVFADFLPKLDDRLLAQIENTIYKAISEKVINSFLFQTKEDGKK